MFKLRISRMDENAAPISVIGKRIVPEEIPAKSSSEVWRDFLISVKREINFYKMLKDLDGRDSDGKAAQEVQGLFPKVFYSSGKEVE